MDSLFHISSGAWAHSLCLIAEIAAVILIVLLFYLNYWLWFVPINRIRSVEDVGFAHIKHENPRYRKELMNRLRKKRKIGKIPPPFPNGWFVLAESREVPEGKALHVAALGQHFAIFRGRESKQVFVVDPFCPHLGADVTAGGKVKGDCIECPFHEWKFDGQTGKCVDIPYAEKVPDFARLKVWESMEANSLIYVWYHADPESPPTWQPDILPEVDSGSWVYQGRNEFIVSCHIQDIPENGGDVAHLGAVHKSTIFSGGEPTEWRERLMDFAKHEWTIAWKPEDEEDRKHRATINLEHSMTLFDKFKIFSLKVTGEQVGPGTVLLHFKSLFGRGVMLQYVLPLGPLLQKMVHVFYTEPTWIAPYAKIVLFGESVMVERDIKVWNSKMYADKPILVKEDKLILQHRRWYSQFYCEKSKKLGECQNTLEW